MTKQFKVGDHVSWNSQVGHTQGNIVKIHTKDIDYQGKTYRANKDEPKYEVKSEKTGHIAFHKGEALKKVDG
jgi:hypothetical protein